MAHDRPVADWRSPDSYAPFHLCGRHAFAWEWLRRSRAFQDAVIANAAGLPPERFGLHRYELWDRSFAEARPIWTADADPFVLTVAAVPASDGADAFDIARFDGSTSLVTGSDGREHWLLSDGPRQIRIDIVEGSLARGPARLSFRIEGLRHAAQRILALQRFIALARTGCFPDPLFPAERRASRWAQVLRVHDALCAGASQREIAELLFDLYDLRRWRIEAPSYRRRVQRLVEAARAAAWADPRLWLSGQFP